MKTKEQIKSEVLSYLKKSSIHLFTINETEHKVLIKDDYYIIISGQNISINSIDNKIEYYGQNTKCVIKNEIFLIPRYYKKDIKTIKNYKLAKDKYNQVLDEIKNKTDKKDIKESIKLILDKYKKEMED